MALIKSLNNYHPIISSDVFLANNATVIGDVRIGEYSSVWFNAVIRGDVNSIIIGSKVNIQDGAVIQKNSIIAAGSVITKDTLVKSGSIYGGLPGKLIKKMSEEEIANLTYGIANNYVKYSSWYV